MVVEHVHAAVTAAAVEGVVAHTGLAGLAEVLVGAAVEGLALLLVVPVDQLHLVCGVDRSGPVPV